MYSADGTQITLYLDGVGVPVTQSQRALTKEMAQMSHDFYEVVFLAYDSGDPVVARATWEIGQSAGIKGVYGSNITGGFQYVPATLGTPSPGSSIESGYVGVTSIFTGKKVDKTLLGVGRMTQITYADGTTDLYRITSSTKSVTFTVNAITTKLDPYTDDIEESSLLITFDNSRIYGEYVSLGGVQYPYYKLPKGDSIDAAYQLGIDYSYMVLNYMRVINNSFNKPEFIKREPRFLSGGRYYYVQIANLDTVTEVRPNTAFSDGNYLHRLFNLTFDTSNSQGGIFSFTFRIPVYNITREPSTNGGGSFTTWYVQPGFGRDLWSLDNGKDAGGCILMGYNADVGDWIDIFTTGP